MKYKLLGHSGLRVSEISLGTMTFGEEWGWGASKDESKKMFDAYAETGGNFIDTANRYTEGTSEKYVGEFIKASREKFVLATKYSLFMQKGDPNSSGNHRKNMMQALDASLKRLGTDYIDLYWLHAWDFTTPVEEVMRSLDDMVRAGKVLYLGISDTPAWIVSQANTIAMLRGWTPFVALQIEYSLIQRTPERDLLPMAKAFDMAVTPWAPLAGGALTGKYLRGESGRIAEGSARRGDQSNKIAQEVVNVAKELGVSPGQVAIKWTMQKNQVMIPIVGATKATQIQDSLGCVSLTIPDEHLKRLDDVSKIELGFPHDFLASAPVREVLSGGTYDSVENHRKLS